MAEATSPPRPFFVPWAVFAATLLLAACGEAAPPAHPAIPPTAASLWCSSAATGGGGWMLTLDAAHARADGQPASFGPRHVDWRNAADLGAYELDLATGALTITRASSTGGYQVFFTCRPQSSPAVAPAR